MFGSITNEIYETFEYNSLTDLRGSFLDDVSKVFDKVWHKTYGLDENLIKLLEHYYTGQKQ